MTTAVRSLALVTGAASGIGLELAKCCAEHGFDLVVAAEQPEIQLAAQTCRDLGAMVLAVQTDLSTIEGVERLWTELQGCGQPVEMVLASTGHGPAAGAFLDQDFNRIRHAIDTDLLGMLSLLHKTGGAMRERGQGRILIAGSEVQDAQATRAGAQAFLETFAAALRSELKESGVRLLCLMPNEADPAKAARQGFEAMMSDDEQTGEGNWQDKLRAALSQITPPGQAEPRPSH